MKAVSALVLAGICLVIYGWRNSQPAGAPGAGAQVTVRESKPIAEIQVLKADNIRKLPPARQSAIRAIEGQIEALNERQKNIDQELARAGFPGVFQDDRLSDSEREQLLAKVQQSTALGIEIAKLKFKQIDLTATEKL